MKFETVKSKPDTQDKRTETMLFTISLFESKEESYLKVFTSLEREDFSVFFFTLSGNIILNRSKIDVRNGYFKELYQELAKNSELVLTRFIKILLEFSGINGGERIEY